MHRASVGRWMLLFVIATGIAVLVVAVVAWMLPSPVRDDADSGTSPDEVARILKPKIVGLGNREDVSGEARELGHSASAGVANASFAEPCPIELQEITPQTGIEFQHTDGSSGQYYIVETVSSGLATFDYDGDGKIDIYFPNGAPLPGAKPLPPPRHALYRNLGNWRFKDVTDEANVGCTAYGLGAAVADYDNDGFQDLYVTAFGFNVLYHNRGNGTFTEATREAGVRGLGKVGAGACFLDADNDGNLDLYVANYLDFSFEKNVRVRIRGVPAYARPASYPPLLGLLFLNLGNGVFSDASEASGIGRHANWGMGAVAADYDIPYADRSDTFWNVWKLRVIRLLRGFR